MRLAWRSMSAVPTWTAHHRSIWTKDKVEELRERWGSGLTAREIADRLGEDFSRAAVIGKANRLGLAQQKPSFTPTENGRRKRPVPRPAPPPPLPKPMPLPPERTGPPRMRRLQVVQLEDGWCKWPIGQPGRGGFFCAADAVEGRVYCETHLAVAFARPRHGR